MLTTYRIDWRIFLFANSQKPTPSFSPVIHPFHPSSSDNDDIYNVLLFSLEAGKSLLQIPCYHISPNLGTDTHCPLCDTATPDSFTPFFMVWHIQLKPSHSSKNQPTTEMTFLRCPKCNYQCLRVCRWSSPSCSWRYSLQRSSFNMPNAYF